MTKLESLTLTFDKTFFKNNKDAYLHYVKVSSHSIYFTLRLWYFARSRVRMDLYYIQRRNYESTAFLYMS